VCVNDFPSPRNELILTLDLRAQERTRQIGDSEVIARHRKVVPSLRIHALTAKCANTEVNLSVLNDKGSSLPGGEDLVPVEREGPNRRQTADRLAFVECEMGLCSILYNPKPVHRSNVVDAVHIRRMAIKVYCDDPASTRCDSLLDGFCVDAPGLRIYIDEHRLATDVTDTVRRCDIRQRRKQDLVAGPYIERQKREVKSDCPVTNPDRVTRAAKFGKLELETVDKGSGRRDP
jgi:hypothetical protein